MGLFDAVNSFYQNSGPKQLVNGALSIVLNQASSALNSHRAWKYAVKQNTLNYLTNKRQMLEYYPLSRQSLENAGYNPLLAIGSGAQGSAIAASAPLSDSDQGDQAIQSAIASRQQENNDKMTKSQLSLNDSQKDLNTQLTYKALADEIYARSNSAVSQATRDKILNDIYWDNEKNAALVKQINAETKFTNERARGFSASSSESSNTSAGANIGNKVGAQGSHGSSKSSSRSW